MIFFDKVTPTKDHATDLLEDVEVSVGFLSTFEKLRVPVGTYVV